MRKLKLNTLGLLFLLINLACVTTTTMQEEKNAKTQVEAVDVKGLDRQKYETRYNLTSGSEGDSMAVERCLSHWGKHPFDTANKKRFRLINPSVEVLGIGGDIIDDAKSTYPQIILIKPTVNVMTKSVYVLNNPNGWYCFKNNVNILAKNVIRANCHTHIADSRNGLAVMGKNDKSGKGGVTVLGKLEIRRTGC